MELFHEYKNRYFNLVFKLLNLSQRGLSREEIISLIDQEEYDEKLISKNLVTFEGMLLNECDEEDRCVKPFNFKLLFIQAIATAIDALSVGVIMIDYKLNELIIALLLIMIVTFIFSYIADTVSAMTEYALKNYGNLPVVFAGGVMSNVIIKDIVTSRFDCSFAEPEFSCDNAAGIAFLTSIKANK